MSERIGGNGGVRQRVPNSSGEDPPRLVAPAYGADCHIHIYDPRFPAQSPPPSVATATDYRLLLGRLGLTRVVIVQPRNYGTDHACTLDAIRQLAPHARAVGVVRPDVTEAELKRLDAGGVRGIRFTTGDPRSAIVSSDMIEPLARRIAAYGWHVQLNMPVEEILACAPVLRRLPVQIVFDHLGKVPSVAHPAFAVIRELVDAGRAWVKVSGAYMNTTIGPPAYPDATRVAQAYVRAAPERVVWGSNWPHPGPKVKPDDALLLDLLFDWAPDDATRRRILVTNPETLYGFERSA